MLFFIMKRKFNKNQTKLGIKTLDWNVPKKHISRFVVELILIMFSIDGTIKKSYNSNNNTITKKETQILVDYYEGRLIDPECLEKLHKPAQRILKKKDISDEDKLELLYGIETQFTFTTQDRIPVNDIEARFMKGKKGNFMVAYNIQSAVDYDTKLICAINVT